MHQRVAGIDDILHHQHVAPRDLAAQVLEDAHLARGLHRVAIGGGFEEIDLHRQVELPHQIGDEDETAAQKTHQHQLLGPAKVASISRASSSMRAAIDLAEIICRTS
jgi:hypothetical protein